MWTPKGTLRKTCSPSCATLSETLIGAREANPLLTGMPMGHYWSAASLRLSRSTGAGERR